MTVRELGKEASIINQYLAELRDVELQSDRLRFRRNMERIGEIIAYEISRELEYETQMIQSPLGEAEQAVLKDQPILATILRAGLPMHQGMLNVYDQADNCFVSAFRKYHKGGKFEIELEYVSCPNLDDKVLIIADPMLATGSSMALVYQTLRTYGEPKKIHLAAAIASSQGITYLKSKVPKEVTFWTGAIDNELTAQAYIVPGLGDAGDLSYGAKDH